MESIFTSFIPFILSLLPVNYPTITINYPTVETDSRTDKNVWMFEKCRLLECNAKILAKVVPPKLKSAVQEIKFITKVPIVVPLVQDNLLGEKGFVSKNVYRIDFNLFKGCRGARGCTYGFIEAELIHKDTLSGIQQYKAYRLDLYDYRFGEAREIALPTGISAFYVPPLCTAYCGPSRITWRQDGFQYRVGTYYNDPRSIKELIKWANSAIENQP